VTEAVPAHNPQVVHPIEDHWITLDGARMRYLRSGSGPALVLVHGLLGYSFSWRHLMPALAPQATLYAVDMLGVGFSDRPPGLDASLRGCAERLVRFLDATAINSCNLLGTSHGGAVAMMAAALAPHRIRNLILVAPVNPWLEHGRRIAALLNRRSVKCIFLHAAPLLRPAHGYFLRRLFGDVRRIRPGTLEGYSAPFTVPGTFEHGVRMLNTWSQDLKELESLLPRIREIRTLLIWGSVDPVVAPVSAARLRQQFRSCAVVTLDGVGHLPYEEMPEKFNRVVAEFLAEKSVAA